VAEITAAAVKALRDQTGAGMMDCKRVLQDADGDAKRAVELLRERGLARAGKREGRATSEGVIAIALDAGAGGMIELGCETDFVARTDYFKELADALASAVVADGSIDSAEALLEGQVEGEKVADKMTAAIAKLGENVVLKRAVRLEVEGPGIAGGYVHAGAKLGVLVGLCTPASGPSVEGLAKDLSMHVAAADPTPLAVDRDGISPELLASERSIYRKQAEQEGKPAKVIDRIVEGKLGKFIAEVCLLEQAFVKDPDRSIGDLLRDVGKEVDAEIVVSGFRRFKLGGASEA
jgi:elongation factor Ts